MKIVRLTERELDPMLVTVVVVKPNVLSVVKYEVFPLIRNEGMRMNSPEWKKRWDLIRSFYRKYQNKCYHVSAHSCESGGQTSVESKATKLTGPRLDQRPAKRRMRLNST